MADRSIPDEWGDLICGRWRAGYETREVTQKDYDDALAYVADKIKHQFDE